MNKNLLKNLAFIFLVLTLYTILAIPTINAQDSSSGLKGGSSDSFDIIAGAIGVIGDAGSGESENYNITIHGNQQPYGKGNSSNINVSLGYLYTLDNIISILPQIILNWPTNNSYFGDLFFRTQNISTNATVIDPDNDLVDIYFYGSNSTDQLSHGGNSLLAYYPDQPSTVAGINFSVNWTAPIVTPEYGREGTQGPVLIMHFDNRSEFGENDSQVYDFSGFENNGTCNGNVCPILNHTKGIYQKGYSFDGSNDAITIQDHELLDMDNDAMTMAAWITMSDVSPGIEAFISKYDAGSNLRQYIFYRTGDEISVIFTEPDNSNNCAPTTSMNLQADRLYHVVATFYGTGGAIYVNGNEEATCSTSPDMQGNNQALTIGANTNDGQYFNGVIDELAIWNRSLTPQEIQELYQLGSDKYYWKINVTESATGYRNQSETRQFIINRNKPRINSSINNSQPKINEVINISANVTDDYNLSYCYFLSNQSLVTYNKTVTTRNDQCSQNFTIERPRGNVINFTIITFDSANNTNQSEQIVTIANTPPTKVQLIELPTNNITTNRTPLLSWTNATDPDNDTITFLLDLRCVECTIDNRYENITHTNTTILEPLQFLADENYFYNWTITASDNRTYGQTSNASNFSINSFVSLRMDVNSVDFGTLDLGDEQTTHDDSPNPFVVENDGNVNLNITVNANQSIWQSEQIPNSSFQYKIDNTTEINSFEYFNPNSTVNWTNITPSPVLSIVNLSYLDRNDTAEIDIRVQVPLDEPQGSRSSKIVLEARY